MNLPFVYVRAKAKDHGTKKLIEGDLKQGKHVVLIEDLLSTGGSAIASVEALREEGKATICDVIAIFSYELMAGIEKAQIAQVHLHPLSTFTVLLDVASAQGRMSEEHIETARQFIRDPENWRQ